MTNGESVGNTAPPIHGNGRLWPFSGKMSPETVAGLTFVLPIIALFIVLRFIPASIAFLLSFTEYNVLQPPTIVGLQNYQRLLDDTLFWTALTNTVVYAIGTTIGSTFVALAIALALNQRLPGRALFRTAYFIPIVVSPVAVSTIWAYLLNTQFGLINYLVSFAGIPRISWLENPTLALLSLIGVSIWGQLGFNTVIFLAGLQSMPQTLSEAASVDGLMGWRRFRRLTWPLLLPTTTLVIIITAIYTFQAFDLIVNLTGGGPGDATTTLVHQIYLNAFRFGKMGYASAMAFILFLVILILTAAAMRLRGREIRW